MDSRTPVGAQGAPLITYTNKTELARVYADFLTMLWIPVRVIEPV